jgi:plasmid stabilization system protein ParE
MPRVIVTENAGADLIRLREFIKTKNPQAAGKVGKTLADAFRRLADHPHMGRPIENIVGLHCLVVPFGVSSYVIHYRYISNIDELYILRVAHSKENE